MAEDGYLTKLATTVDLPLKLQNLEQQVFARTKTRVRPSEFSACLYCTVRTCSQRHINGPALGTSSPDLDRHESG